MFVSNVPAYIVTGILHIIVGLCLNMILIFVMLSVIRCLLCHEVFWFVNLNENIVALVVNITSALITITQRIVVHLFFFSEGLFARFSHLYSDPNLCDTDSKTRRPFFMYILVTFSLLLELYIGMIIKKLSCIRFIPVTIGHLYMIAIMHILINYQYPMIPGMQPLTLIISLQLMYVLRQRDYTIELLKKYWNVANNTVVPVNDSIELNEFGIFVGPQVISDPNNNIESYPRDDEFGGVYVG